MLSKINEFFTPPRRKAIYGLVTAAVAAAIAFNILTADQIGGTAEAILSVLTALTTLMAFFNTGAGPADQ
jgi:hypothetical protein